MRYSYSPYYNLFSKSGRYDIRWAIKHYGWSWDLGRDIIGDSWFGLKWRLGKR